ncbi:acyl-[ACP]--phospholipid O-acyltransferase [Robbsia sp. KACC 23696]|uniref:acyl-[ACP]--phospholipid O-acyltransferase n=1 Tax=Robbsia sp. KACC 23696 TaxID=3149231 RepID=UPI00325B51F5
MSLFRTKRFLPLFLTQFFGALNDNMLKNAMIMLITYRMASEAHDAQSLVTVAGGLFVLPFFLFSAMAGQMADKYDRAAMTRVIKVVEIVIMVIAVAGFYLHSVAILMVALAGMGIHSTFFGPIKYALLPQQLKPEELLEGNAFIEAGTFLAILIGTIAGGALVLRDHGETLICIALIAIAVIGYLSSRQISAATPSDPSLRINRNLFTETGRIVSQSFQDKAIKRCILGSSWFWFVGATLLAQFAPYVKDVLRADPSVVTLLLTVFSVGVGLGSYACDKLLRGEVQATYVPLAALGLTLFGIDLYVASQHAAALVGTATAADALQSLQAFMRVPANWRVLFDLGGIAVCGGIYIVPLYAIMQHRSPPAHRARVIAANNVMNALFMVVSAVLTLVLLKLHFTIPELFLFVAIANGAVALYICRLLPDALFRSILRAVLTLLYRVEVRHPERYAQAGERVLIVANHTSFLDAVLIAAFLPEKLHFAVNTHVARVWWMKPVLSLVKAFPLDPTNPLAAKSLIDLLKRDEKCMIFPEGRLTVTGALMKIYEGPGMIADRSGAQLLPIRIDGAQYTPFSRLRGKVRIRWFPRITLTILPPQRFAIPDDIKGRGRRQMASAQLYDVMSEMMFQSARTHKTLFEALLNASAVHGRNRPIAEDIERKPLRYGAFILRAFTLGRVLSRGVLATSSEAGAGARAGATAAAPGNTALPQIPVGVMLPNTVAASVVFFALQAIGRAPAMLNFTSGAAQTAQACGTAQLRTVLTSRRFIGMAKLEASIDAMTAAGVTIVYLEDLAPSVRWHDKAFGLLASRFPHWAYAGNLRRAGLGKQLHADAVTDGKDTLADTAAVVLYTSGSEGSPKGVVLSHRNILANCSQVASRVDFGPQDIVLNVLPMFHSFGLTGGTLLPILAGIKAFYYPSPLHYRIVPELIYDTNATIMFGTDTFLSAYARAAHPYDMHSIRYIFAGAEKLRDETRRVYADKYGVRIFEGYGATEMSPVISLNTPMQNQPGSVGRLLPGITHRLERVPGIDNAGLLFVKGPNVMRGYLKADAPGVLQAPADGWYDTGDIVSIDPRGYVTIQGRQKRFAKIAGEMVSLTAVESTISALWPEQQHAAVNLPDPRKGEQIVLLTTRDDARRDALLQWFQQRQVSELALPRRIIVVPKLPTLGTGKTDYQQAKQIALASLSENGSE